MESSAVNAPHQNDQAKDEADLFFGEEEEGGTEAQPEAESVPAEETPAKPEPQVGPTPEAQAAMDAVKDQREAVEDAPGAVEDPPEPAVGESTAPAGASGSGPATPASGDEPQRAKTSGALEREYVVLHKVPLTKRALEHLLKEIEQRGGEARIAYLAIEPRPVARNDKGALSEIYRRERRTLGDEATLVAVSSRSFTERKVRPKQREPEETLDIS